MAANKKPPTFHHLPKNRATRLKKSWVEDQKIRSKWKAQKRRERVGQASAPIEHGSTDRRDEANVEPERDDSRTCIDEPSIPPPAQDKRTLRDLRRIAYASEPPRTEKSDSSHPKRAPARDHGDRSRKGCKTGQPNMKLRMNVLLEKIKRDI